MTDNFEAEVCGGSNWPWQWNPSLGALFNSSSPCCSSNFDNMVGGFGLFNPEFLGNKAWSSDESTGSPTQPVHNNSSIDSSSQILGIGVSSSMATDWNPTLLQGNGSSEVMNYTDHMMQQEDQEASRMNSFDQTVINNNDFSLIQKPIINSLSNTNTSPSSESLSNNLPIINTGPYGYTSDLLQINLFENEPQTKQSLYDTSKLMNDYQATLNEFSRNSFSELSSSSMEKQKPANLLQLSANNTDFCNESSAVALGPQFFPSATNYGKRPNLPNFKAMNQNDEIEGLGTVTKKSNSEATFKRPRIETPTPLPTFKVRKEKMGDRITALQQLVSPFGKTDTASVLHEAIEYIKFLHDQVNVLSTPYLKNGAPIQRLQNTEKSKEKEPKQDLKSRGLCLVPISSTFPVAAENTTDFWIPTFGGTFR